MRRALTLTFAAALLAAAAPAQAEKHHDWDLASSLVRDGLVAAALGGPALDGDWEGTRQDALAMGAAGGATAFLKRTIPEQRPDRSGDNSFPSGHTSISFAAAAGLEQRFGWKVGVPVHLAAAFVGLARVEADKHYWHDVIVGAAIGEVAGLLLVDKRHKQRGIPLGATVRIAF